MSLQTTFRQEHLGSPTQFLPGRNYVSLSNRCLQWHLFTVNDFEPQSSCEPMSRLEYYMTGCHAVVFAASVFCLASFFFFAQMNAPWIRCSLCHATREEYVFTRYNYRYIRRAERDRSSSPSPPGFLQHQSEDQNGTYFLYWKGWNFSVLQEKRSCFTMQIMLFVR